MRGGNRARGGNEERSLSFSNPTTLPRVDSFDVGLELQRQDNYKPFHTPFGCQYSIPLPYTSHPAKYRNPCSEIQLKHGENVVHIEFSFLAAKIIVGA